MPSTNMISIGNNRLFSLNSFNVQKVVRRGSRMNIFNELDDFFDDQVYFSAPENTRQQNPQAPVVPQGVQAKPNNNNLVSTEKGNEPNNAVKDFKDLMLKKLKLKKSKKRVADATSEKRKIVPEAEKVRTLETTSVEGVERTRPLTKSEIDRGLDVSGELPAIF